MDPRTRVRQFLAHGTADRPPFLAMATDYTARLAQCDPADLLADPGLFVRSFTKSATALGLEAVLIEVPAATVLPIVPAADPAARAKPATVSTDPTARVLPATASTHPAAGGFAVLRENLHRLRATLRDQLAIVALLPGPLSLSAALGEPPTPDSLDDLVAALIRLQEYLGPADLDALALLERTPVTDPDIPSLTDATAAFWNVARYYSLPSLLVAARATPRLATTGPTAVAAWSGATAPDLLSAGATAAGQPPPPVAAPLPPGGFYLTPDEIPADQPVDAVRSLIRQLSQPLVGNEFCVFPE
jgi:hypothetical protein